MIDPDQESDLSESLQYAAFVESMVPFCYCAQNRPCDGVLAGGICDDVQDEEPEWEDET
jgi:hypothetical protein